MKFLTSQSKAAYIAALESQPDQFEEALKKLARLLPSVNFNGEAEKLKVIRYCLRFGQAAYVWPEASLEILDLGFQEWQTGQPLATTGPQATRQVPKALSDLLWEQIEYPPDTNRLIRDTTRLHAALTPELQTAYVNGMLQRKGVNQALESGFSRPAMTLNDLADCLPGTLGNGFYHQLADNGLSLEIVPGYRQPESKQAVFDYVGRRMYETHDIRHVLLGYSTSGEDELALQAFEQAQAGTAFSAHVLAWISASTLLDGSPDVKYVLNFLAYGWQHGRRTPPVLPVQWEKLWDMPLAKILSDYALQPSQTRGFAE